MSAVEAEPQFSQPIRQTVQMLIVVALAGVGGWMIYPSVKPVFFANPYLNGAIGLVFVFGVLNCFLQVAQLSSSVRWIEAFARDHRAAETARPPRMLAPLAGLLRSRGVNRQISSTSASSILDSVGTRIEEARDITRYIGNLLIFLGLLGTFYGLATTVPAVVDTIRSLAPQEGESGVDIFAKLMNGLEAQLGGMGTAFGSSLLGLTGSLVVGLLELFASRGQNRFYRELEEWLSTITRLGFAGAEVEGAGDAGPVLLVLDHMAEQMSSLREIMAQSDLGRAVIDDRLSEVATAVTALTRTLQHGDRSTAVLERIAEGQDRIAEGQDRVADVQLRIADGQARIAEGQEALVERLSAPPAAAEEGADHEARMRLRSIDVQLLRVLEELAAGRQETVAEIRAEIAGLAREVRKGRAPALPQGSTGTVVGPRD
ncbi:biopolymer transporter ExbB [Tropicimonas sp. IMCC34043]|uniref:biopolymer transporter ExbB n=1 Tax=Tropicimonas sp. IMCC34043 TaxID=2248760 RepID=UPI000E23E455|nr:biopolymer transporter ExbB [Tropicimonas sp. IMCC34043]